MDKSEIITATEASRAFSDVLHRVCYGGESFIVKKGHRLMARIVPVEEAVEVPRPAAAEKKEPAKKPAAKKAEAPRAAPPAIQKSEAVSTRGMSIPEGLTAEDVSFYENLIANIPKSTG